VNGLKRPGFRFSVEVILIVLAAFVGGLLHLGVWGIIALVASVWVVAAVVEHSFSRHREPRAAPVVVAPVAYEPVPVAPPRPRNWNLWDVERALRDRGPDEEREYLLMYLRDDAGPDGQLPLEFDDLVRESFGELLGAPTG
jgi:hypothetical protein